MTGPDLAADFMLLGVRESGLYLFRQCVIAFMQVISSQECLQRSQNSASSTRMLVWPSSVPMQAGTTHNGEGLCCFYLKRVNGRKQVWIRHTERHVPATIIPTAAFQGGRVMVLAGISATAKTDLVFIE